MVELRIPKKDIVLDFEKEIGLSSLTYEQAMLELAQAYAFLGKPLGISINHDEVVIMAEVGKPHLARAAARSFERANEAGRRGQYDRAILLYKQGLEITPDSVDARRNLAMAHLEMWQLDKAKQHLLEALRLDPKDAWSNMLAGNILAKYEHKLEAAMKWYRRAYETTPNDPILLTNIGAMLKEQGQTAEAIDYFSRAIAADPKYPNARYALALTRLEYDEPEMALDQIDALFSTAEPLDTRSNPLWGEARKLYARANEKLVEKNLDAVQQAVQARQAEIAELTGHRVVIQEDPSLKFVTGISQMAWRYRRDYHLIKYHVKSPLIAPHILFHELQHIEMVDAARKAGRNRYFATSETSQEQSLRLIQEDARQLQSYGIPADAIDQTVKSWIEGLALQLFNIPLDMTIEHNLYTQYPDLRPAQFTSLHSQQLENVRAVTDPSVKRLSPHRIYRPSVAMTCAYALFTDFLYEGRTDYATSYRSSNAFAAGERLFKLWKDSLGVFEAGDEYILVDEFARELRLQEWYHWISETELALADPDRPEGSTNPELLRSLHPAAIWHLLDALQRFDGMSSEEVRNVTAEIAIIGTTGLDYASPEAKYSVRSLSSDKKYTGLQLMCYMYVGFKILQPDVDSTIDLDEPYQAALALFRPQHPREDE